MFPNKTQWHRGMMSSQNFPIFQIPSLAKLPAPVDSRCLAVRSLAVPKTAQCEFPEIQSGIGSIIVRQVSEDTLIARA
jgi:hypothetical protein